DLKAYQKPAAAAFRPASYGYLLDGLAANVYRFAGRMLAQEIHFSVSEHDITFGDRTFPRGTLLVLKGNNRPDLDAALERITHDTGLTTFPLETGWAGGTAFGSQFIHYVKDPKIALVGGGGTASPSYGMLCHTLDVDTPVPHTNLPLDALRNTDLSHYSVLILPDGD